MNEEYGDLSKAAKGTGQALRLGKSAVQGTGKVVKGGKKAAKKSGELLGKIAKYLVSTLGVGTFLMIIVLVLLAAAVGGAAMSLLGQAYEEDSDTSVDITTFETNTALHSLARSFESTATRKVVGDYFTPLSEWQNTYPRPADWCSAYVGSLMKQTGIDLAEYFWKPYPQEWYNTLADNGKIKHYSEAHAGDLIFYANHVGILVDVNKSSGYYLVSSDSMDETYGNYVVKSHQITEYDILGVLPMPKTTDSQFTIRKHAPGADNEYYKNENNAYANNESELLFTVDGVFQGGIRAYAWARAYEVYGDYFFNRRPLPITKPAYDWYDNFTHSKGNNPRAGSIACWKGEEGIGLVAFVEQVKKNGNIVVSYSIRSNDSTQNFVYKEIPIKNGTYNAFDYTFQGFLYLNSL